MIIIHLLKPLLHKRCYEQGIQSDWVNEKRKLAKAIGSSEVWVRALLNDPYLSLNKEFELRAAKFFGVKESELYKVIKEKKIKHKKNGEEDNISESSN